MKRLLRIFIIFDSYVIVRSCIVFLMILLNVYVTKATSLRSHWNFRLSTITLKESYHFDMCTYGRFVTNKYTGVTFWSKCGKCEACKQEKAAARAARIRAEYSKDVQVFFCELDYDRFSCPYFTQADYDKIMADTNNHVFKLPIYRDHSVKWNIKTQSYFHSFKPVLLYNHIIDDNDFQYMSELQTCQWLNKSPRKIGVPYFKDIQDFEKRFRMWLKRKLNYDKKIKFFNVNECGEKRQRPHFHFLLYASGLTEAQVREAVVACWPFSNRAKYEKIAVSQGKNLRLYSSSLTIQRAMLLHTLIAIRTFHRFCAVILKCPNTVQVSSLVTVYQRFLWKRYRKKSVKEICSILLSELEENQQNSLIFLFPSTLSIDISHSSRDILGLLIIRFLSFYQAVSISDTSLVKQLGMTPGQILK